MHILLAIPGHLKTVPMGRFCTNALQKLGHEVIVFDYRRGPSDKLLESISNSVGLGFVDAPAMNLRLRRLIRATRPEVFITLYGFFISPKTLDLLRELKIPSACWWINDPFQFERSLKRAPLYDAVFTNDSTCVQEYLSAGVRAAWFLPTACEPAVHKPMPFRPEFASDVCFAGDWSPLREKLLLQLVGRFNLKIFGPWGRKLSPDSPLRPVLRDGFFSPEEMASMFSSATITLNIHTWNETADHGVNPRLFEAASCGAAQLVDWKHEIPDLFDIHKDLLTYKTIEEVPSRVEEALASRAKLAEMGASARHRALAEHTYEHRMERMLALLAQGRTEKHL
jgi:spore maturation protein CgeB